VGSHLYRAARGDLASASTFLICLIPRASVIRANPVFTRLAWVCINDIRDPNWETERGPVQHTGFWRRTSNWCSSYPRHQLTDGTYLEGNIPELRRRVRQSTQVRAVSEWNANIWQAPELCLERGWLCATTLHLLDRSHCFESFPKSVMRRPWLQILGRDRRDHRRDRSSAPRRRRALRIRGMPGHSPRLARWPARAEARGGGRPSEAALCSTT
jgi:hypothetical protein